MKWQTFLQEVVELREDEASKWVPCLTPDRHPTRQNILHTTSLRIKWLSERRKEDGEWTGEMCVQERRMTAAAALSHPYVDEGRLRYHTCMCQCCPNLPDGVRYTTNSEPVCSTPFHYVFEDELNSISRVKGSWSLSSVYRPFLLVTNFLQFISRLLHIHCVKDGSCSSSSLE